MAIPLQLRLKKRVQVETASLQDELIEILYAIDDRLLLHGGTAIWRCYAGNRFSEDLDFYGRDPGQLSEELSAAVAKRGLAMIKSRQTRNMLFLKVRGGEFEVRVEVNTAAGGNPVIARYERVDGTMTDILSLSAVDLVKEKILAYRDRALIRDLYDIHHLLRQVERPAALRPLLRGFLSSMPEPADETNLRALVYSGVAPTFRQLVESIRRMSL